MGHVACKTFEQLPTKSPVNSNDNSTSYINYVNWRGLVRARTCMSTMYLVGQLCKMLQHTCATLTAYWTSMFLAW